MDGWNQRRVSSLRGNMGWNKDQDEDGEVIERIWNMCAALNNPNPERNNFET